MPLGCTGPNEVKLGPFTHANLADKTPILPWQHFLDISESVAFVGCSDCMEGYRKKKRVAFGGYCIWS